MGWLGRLFGERDTEALPLYQAITARARQPHWYLDGAVADTIDGRFDMIAAVLGLVVLRLEQEAAQADAAARLSTVLTERFVDDMDGQLREQGVGDVVVGKHIGRMMGMLGGRLGAYRDGLLPGGSAGGADDGLDAALVRNLYRGQAPAADALAYVRGGLLAFRDALAATPVAALAEGRLP